MQGYPEDVLRDIREFLTQERALITNRIGDLSHQDPFCDPDRLNDNAASDMEATEESNHDRFVALVEEQKIKLNEVITALGAIEAGTYGFCTNCGNMIDTDRLAALPTATLCLTCERKKSRGAGSALGGK